MKQCRSFNFEAFLQPKKIFFVKKIKLDFENIVRFPRKIFRQRPVVLLPIGCSVIRRRRGKIEKNLTRFCLSAVCESLVTRLKYPAAVSLAEGFQPVHWKSFGCTEKRIKCSRERS